MKLNIANPATGANKTIEVDDDLKLRHFYEKRMAQELDADFLGDEWKGYIVRVCGGNDKQGFPMMQGVLSSGRARLLLNKTSKCYRPRKVGEKRRKSVRGCIVDSNLSVLNLKIVKKGEGELPGLTDKTYPRTQAPKRASKIRKLFNLSKEDDVRDYAIRRSYMVKVKGKEKKREKLRPMKIQRLITPVTLARRKRKAALRRTRRVKNIEEAATYAKLLAMRVKEKMARERKSSRSSASLRMSESRVEAKAASLEAKASRLKKDAEAKAKAPEKPAAKGKAAPKVTKSAGRPKPTEKPAAKPAGKPAAKSAGKPAAKPAGKPGGKPKK